MYYIASDIWGTGRIIGVFGTFQANRIYLVQDLSTLTASYMLGREAFSLGLANVKEYDSLFNLYTKKEYLAVLGADGKSLFAGLFCSVIDFMQVYDGNKDNIIFLMNNGYLRCFMLLSDAVYVAHFGLTTSGLAVYIKDGVLAGLMYPDNNVIVANGNLWSAISGLLARRRMLGLPI